ncbi:MAG: DUF4276 family protein [Gammaproteobacteria bacterium]|nr:DUF4276 family protein [Gammaproteobacteria bacterium]
MREIVFFLEEPSAREMLKGVLKNTLPKEITPRFVVFQGKQDLEKRLPIRLRAWQQSNTLFVVIRDQDSGNCINIKQALKQKCSEAGQPNTLIRIACRELESFYLGDLKAVAHAFNLKNLAKQQNKSKFRDPDRLGNPAEELKKMVPNYQKISGSRAIAPLLNITENRSNSFNALISGIQRIITEEH